MGNIIDYISWRGDLLMDVVPFNEVDNLFLNELTYAHMEKYVLPHERITLAEAAERYLAGDNDPDLILGVKAIGVVGSAPRFKDIVMYDLEWYTDEDCQFAAVCYELPDGKVYIVFRGTDETISGWREDFETSYHETQGQGLATDYLIRHLTGNEKKYYVGGHSKGGNLAKYTAMMVPEEQQDLIINIFDLDGPGICRDMLNESKFNRIRDRIIRYVPGYSVVGQLFAGDNPGLCTRIIKSDAKGIMQHDTIKWQALGDHLIYEEEMDRDSRMINNIFFRWIESTELSERESFVKEYFGALAKNGSLTTFDMRDRLLSEVVNVGKSVVTGEKEAKKALNKFLNAIRDELMSAAGEKVTAASSLMLDKVKSVFNRKNKDEEMIEET